jgi:hypothetical protein
MTAYNERLFVHILEMIFVALYNAAMPGCLRHSETDHAIMNIVSRDRDNTGAGFFCLFFPGEHINATIIGRL